MLITTTDKQVNAQLIDSCLRKDERILCRNATVIADRDGNLSWVDNDVPMVMHREEKENV